MESEQSACVVSYHFQFPKLDVTLNDEIRGEVNFYLEENVITSLTAHLLGNSRSILMYGFRSK